LKRCSIDFPNFAEIIVLMRETTKQMDGDDGKESKEKKEREEGKRRKIILILCS